MATQVIPWQQQESQAAFPPSVTKPHDLSARMTNPRRGSCGPSGQSQVNDDALFTLLGVGDKPATSKRESRLPECLKQIFIESNQGKTVDKPPEDHSAFKTFETASPRKPMEFFSPVQLVKPASGMSQLSLVDILNAATTAMELEETETAEAQEEAQGLDVIKQLQQKRAVSGPHVPPNTKPVSKTIPRSYPSTRSPQVFLDVMLRTLGYPTKVYKAVETAYYNEPTALQLSSYHARVQEMIRSQDEPKIRELLTCGISPNPCNRHGESLLHSACRNGNIASVKIMLDCGASVQVADSTGRTILHSALFASTPCFEIVDMILQHDVQLLQLSDRLGTALSYIPRDQWGLWIDFLYAKRHVYFPNRRQRSRIPQQGGAVVTVNKLNLPPNACPLDEPSNALTPEIAAMVVSGKLSPKESKCLMDDDTTDCGDDETTGSLETDTYGAGSECDSLESDDDSWCENHDDDDEEEDGECEDKSPEMDESESSDCSDATLQMKTSQHHH